MSEVAVHYYMNPFVFNKFRIRRASLELESKNSGPDWRSKCFFNIAFRLPSVQRRINTEVSNQIIIGMLFIIPLKMWSFCSSGTFVCLINEAKSANKSFFASALNFRSVCLSRSPRVKSVRNSVIFPRSLGLSLYESGFEYIIPEKVLLDLSLNKRQYL